VLGETDAEAEELTQILNPQRLKSLEEWLNKTAITLTQVNGQRKYGGPPPGWTGLAPGHGCEVFISQIPRDVYEDRLIPLFQSVGPLYEFRLMMNFSGQNRGFAYAKYGDPVSATVAIQTLHHYRLQDGVRINVRRSTEKNQLCLEGLPASVEKEELFRSLQNLSEGVVSVSVQSKGGKELAALVRYSTHYAASMAKKMLIAAFKTNFGIAINVKWFPPKPRHVKDGHEERSVVIPSVPRALPNPHSNFFHHGPQMRSSSCPSSPPPGFSRAVGGPAQLLRDQALSPHLRAGDVPCDALSFLWLVCDLMKLGVPTYDIQHHYTGPDGFIHFSYRVTIPAIPLPFCGAVQILPGASVGAMEREVRQTTAKQVLKALYQLIEP
ncbi:dead end protein 1, partial [Chanos chanos]|uniref:Dead end protein 1 n=1 Tax=Chanos chanos TaxID=29144 RepID=A0A6J2UMN4_CHACN